MRSRPFESLPDDVPLDEIVCRHYVLSKVQRGLKDIGAGQTERSEDLAQEIEARLAMVRWSQRARADLNC